MKTMDSYPLELTKNRQQIEASFIFCLWKNPDSYGDYIKDVKADVDLITDDGRFYYSLGKELYEKNYNSFDDSTIHLYLEDKKTSQAGFIRRGGYKTVDDIKKILSIENLESYYDDLMKSNALLSLHDEGFDVLRYLEKFSKMTYTQLEDFVEYKMNNIFFNSSSSGISVNDLSSGYKKYLEQWDKGTGVGYKVGFPMLNYHLAGIHRKNLILHVGSIGSGKSSSAILAYILPALESGEQVCVIANEQDEEAWRMMILSTVLFNRINYRKINRQKFLFGGFSEDDWIHIEKAEEWLKQYENKLHFVHLTDYGISNVKRVIKKYSKLGVGLYIFDTAKPKDETSDKAWAEFSEVSKELFMLSQKEDVAIIATAQMASNASNRKYLDLSCIGKSRAIAETAGQVILFRTMQEKEKEKLKVYSFDKSTNIKKIHALDPEKDYVIYFVAKNRYGKAGDLQIVYERKMEWNMMKEIGYTHVDYDGF